MGISGLGDDMAEYEKKLKVKIAGGTVQDIKIYSDEADIPPWQKPLRTKFEGTFEGWVPTSPLGSPDASALRVRHPDSDEIYVVNTIGRAVFGKIMYSVPGDFVFEVPTGVRKLRVIVMGGGGCGGGGGGATISGGGDIYVGEASRFGGILSSGGSHGSTIFGGDNPKWPRIRTGYFWPEYNIRGGEALSIGGFSHEGGYGIGAGGTSAMNYGSGFNGGLTEVYMDVTPGVEIDGRVGRGGGYSAFVDGYHPGTGANGGVYLEWGGLIE